MGVIRQVQFTKLIKAGGRQREFNFRQNQGPNGLICRVDTPDDKDGRYEIEFKLEPVGWAWCVKTIPDWLMDVMPQITLAINEPS